MNLWNQTHNLLARFAVFFLLVAAARAGDLPPDEALPRPNILWITCEDISSHIGCYGDTYAITPTIDRLAKSGVRFTNAFATIGVCAPARSTLITGCYPPSLGTQHMRCAGRLPDYVQCFPEYLRKAGYYCTNNAKTDYNFAPPRAAWDESSKKAHWRNRRKGQPFFSVFNIEGTHESKIRSGPLVAVPPEHEPAKAEVPPYLPDTPEVRRDWARYADNIARMDRRVGDILKELADDGLAESTIVFFFSDHGAGMPRSKRWLYDSSLRVPLIVRYPATYRAWMSSEAGGVDNRLVSFVDFGPTVLSMADLSTPKHMHGQAFLGTRIKETAGGPREFIYGFRDRMDERYDLLRCVSNGRYKYIRNFMPQLPWFHHQHISYMYEMPTMKVWQRMADAGELKGSAAIFMANEKPLEELYDTQADPHELRNLAASPPHREILLKLRKVCRDWQREIVDLGFLPEAELHVRFGKHPPHEEVRKHPELYPFEKLAAAADLANARDPKNIDALLKLLADDDSAARYWAAVGLGALGEKAKPAAAALRKSLADTAGIVRVMAADALCRQGEYDSAIPALQAAMGDKNEWVRLQAINVLDRLGEKARPALTEIKAAAADKSDNVVRVAKHALGNPKLLP